MGSASQPAVRRWPFLGPAIPWDRRVDHLVQRLTPDERIALLHPCAPTVERPEDASFRTWTDRPHRRPTTSPPSRMPARPGWTPTRTPKDSHHWYRGLITAHRARTEETTR
ncbi:hypothetical protein ACFY8W_01650 [Streptomyces sp. NPDC012637]|uniref:hypothetical protein n=1 Tax=Streptomyces sp. NPDC012637 TaxID=3364842 RepID=UPI0036E19597